VGWSSETGHHGGAAPFRCKVDCGGGCVSSLAEQGDEDLFALFFFTWRRRLVDRSDVRFRYVKASYKLKKSYQLF
jgi:hypothetical protein